MSEERPIEQALRSIARQKRNEASAMRMHSASRRMLHEEVARCYPAKPSREPWRPWWPRFAISFGLLVALAWGMHSFLRTEPGSGSTGHLAKTDSPMEVPYAPAADGLPASDTATRAAPGAEDTRLSTPDSGAVVSTRPSDSSSDAATSPRETATVPPSAQPLPTAVPAQSLATTNTAFLAASSGTRRNTQLFQNSIPLDTMVSNSALPQVMTSFTVEQAGVTIRIIDADGSIYTGELLPAREPGGNPKAGPSARSVRRGVTSVVVTNYSFQAVGLNRSLNQQVRFSGNLALESGAAGAAPSGRMERRPVTSAPGSPSGAGALQKSRITGQAQVGEGAVVRVEAVAVEPGR